MADFRSIAGHALRSASRIASEYSGEGGSRVNSSARFLIAAVLLAVTAIFLQARSRNELVPVRQPLKAFPQQLGAWTGTDVAIPQDVLDVLGQGDFLLRVYQDDSGRNPDVDLFLAYFCSQRAGDTIHSPKNCLPGAVWSPIEASRISISSPRRCAPKSQLMRAWIACSLLPER